MSPTISHYQVLEKIGQGGIGVVYKARDTLLNRPIALKVLRPERVADRERKRQFIREAKAASALNHPNVVTVHEIGEVEGVHFIVMEWIRGKTLAELIRGQGLSLRETLKYATQLADALAKAHAAGIIHRDLKPANIMVTEDGLVKVLDFGLAELTQPIQTEPIPCDELAETLDMDRALPRDRGIVEGTAAYMSPEQAQGKKVDARSDIFSFGSVVYEMITGRPPFQADSCAAMLAAVLHEEPKPVPSLAPATPRELERIVARCLRKNVNRRFQSMSDLHISLEDLKEEYDSERSSEASMPSAIPAAAKTVARGKTWATIAAGAVLGAVLVSGVWWLACPKAPVPGALRRLTWDLGLSTDPALSSDGRLLAYASDRSGEGNLDIWVRHVAGGEGLRLTRHPADERELAFSPDGSKIAFRSERDQGGVYVIPSLGGEERPIARLGRRPRFSPDGAWIAYWVRDPETNWGRVYINPASGGSPRPVRPDFPDAHNPIWSPDGTQLLFCGTSEIKPPAQDTHDWWIVDWERGSVVKTGAFTAFRRRGLPTAHLPGGWFGNRIVFAAREEDSRNLWLVTISPRTRQLVGEPERLTFGAGIEDRPYVAGYGHLVFASGISNTGIWSLSLSGVAGAAAGKLERVVHRAGTSNLIPSLSADGARCVFISDRDGREEVWIQELRTGKERALTAAAPGELGARGADYDLRPAWPVISRDGSRVAYRVIQAPSPRDSRTRAQSIYVVPAVGGLAEKVCEDCGRPTGWSSDGRQILFEPGERRPPIAVLNLATGEKRELLRHATYGLHQAGFSPDGRWIAFHATVGQGWGRIYVAPYSDGAPVPEREWIPLTDGKADDSIPRWSPDGDCLYFVSNLGGLLSVRGQRLTPATKLPREEPFVVYRFANPRYPPSARFAFAVTHDKMVFSLDELTSNIWMTKLPEP